MKLHDTKNKLLFERLTDQFSGGEIEEGFFSDLLKNRWVSAAEEKLASLKEPDVPTAAQAHSSAENEAQEIADALKSQKEKLEQFANQTVTLLDKAGIEKSDQIYRDIVKSMETALDALKPSDAEVEDAAEPSHPHDWAKPQQQGETTND